MSIANILRKFLKKKGLHTQGVLTIIKKYKYSTSHDKKRFVSFKTNDDTLAQNISNQNHPKS